MDREMLLHTTQMTTASEYQVAIFQHVWDQLQAYQTGGATESLVVRAVAGSGKTTTIVGASHLFKHAKAPNKMPIRALFLAFNKSIATELESRLDKSIDSKTLNALGFSIYQRYARQAHGNVELDKFKTHKILRNTFDKAAVKNFGDDVRFLVGMCKSLGVVPSTATDCVSPNGMDDSDASLMAICSHYNRFIQVQHRLTVFNMVRKVLAVSLADERTIDFDDQKYMTVVKRPGGERLNAFKYDVVIIDEVQDVNAVDIALIQMVLKKNGIVIGVGDSKQAIYGFRGADTEAVEKFKNSFNAVEKPLSITYRCGSEIVAHAQEIVPDIEAAPGAAKGTVTHWNKFAAGDFTPGDMVLCRNNAPLIKFAFKLIKNRVPVFVKGRDIGKNLIALVEKLVGEEQWGTNPATGRKQKTVSVAGVTTVALVKALTEWQTTQRELILEENPDNAEAVERLGDMVQSVMVFVEANTDNKVETVVQDITALFDTTKWDDASDDKEMRGKVILSTVHKAKGLEAERVFMLDFNDCFYPQYIREGSWQMDQERNLDYVARTRAKSFYCYITTENLVDGANGTK